MLLLATVGGVLGVLGIALAWTLAREAWGAAAEQADLARRQIESAHLDAEAWMNEERRCRAQTVGSVVNAAVAALMAATEVLKALHEKRP